MSSAELKLMTFKAHPDDIAGWKARARDQRMTFSAWCRMKMNATDELPPIRYKNPKPAEGASVIAKELLARASTAGDLGQPTVKPSECLNRVRSGAYCPRCGTSHK